MVAIAFALMTCSFCIIDWSKLSEAKSVQSQSSVEGDQTVGGIHLFEIHSPSGGMGLGIKFLLVLAVVAFAIYWCLRRKAKRFRKSFAGQALQTVSSVLPQQQAPHSLAHQVAPAQAAQTQAPPLYYPVATLPPRRQKRRHRDYTSDSESCLPKASTFRRGSQ